ncbi:MAG TPA: hypothetical protein VF469_14780 [Kofleriaceae bacterium]
MKAIFLALALLGCGSVKNTGMIDAAMGDSGPNDTASTDAAVDADLGPHLIFVTSSVHSCALGGITGADAICQARATAAGLPGTYMSWLADDSGSPATRMTHHLGVYQLVTGAAIAQGWNDLTDGNLANKIDRTEGGVQLGGVLCDANQPTCHFICEGGEVWSNVDGAGNRRVGIADCAGWTTAGNGTAGNDGKVNVQWTAGTCTSISSGSLPIFCVQQ